MTAASLFLPRPPLSFLSTCDASLMSTLLLLSDLRPKAYHGGFSLGFNCAEAVNFACADWLPWGQDAISKYRSFKHLAAFSLQKLLCNIAETPAERLVEDGERSLRHVAKALETEVKEESELRDSVFSCGAWATQRSTDIPSKQIRRNAARLLVFC